MTTDSHVCKSCGHAFTGLFCNQCGEKVITPKDRTFGSMVTNILVAITFSNSKFIKSLMLIITKPGFLSKEYAEGRRVNYIRPLQLFFILNLIYFLFPVLQLFNSSFRTQMNYLFHSSLARTVVNNQLAQEGMSMAGFELIYNEKTTGLAKLLVSLFVLLASVPFSLIFIRKNRYYTDHLVLAVELSCFNLFINAIVLYVLLLVTNTVLIWSNSGWAVYLNDINLTMVFVATNLYFLYRSAKIFYGQTGIRLAIKSVLGIVGLFLALEAYRLTLFFITVWSI